MSEATVFLHSRDAREHYDYVSTNINIIQKFLEKEYPKQEYDSYKNRIKMIIANLNDASDAVRDMKMSLPDGSYINLNSEIEKQFEIISKTTEFIGENLNYVEIDKKYTLCWFELPRSLSLLKSLLASSIVFSVEEERIYEELPTVVLEYLRTGELLKDTPEMTSVRSALESLDIISETRPSAYVAIIGPSYMGKTQSAITLAKSGKLVIYVNFSLLAENVSQQQIYFPFQSVSTLILQCLNEDTYRLSKKGYHDYNASSLYNLKDIFSSYTLGLLYFLISRGNGMNPNEWLLSYINLNNVQVTPMSRIEFNRKIKDLKIDKKSCVVFIDELPEYSKNAIKLLRNICRIVHIPTILSGTDSNVCNLQGRVHTEGSRNEGIPLLWVKVISRLPKATMNTIGHVIRFHPHQAKDNLISLSAIGRSESEFLNSILDLSALDAHDIDFLKKMVGFAFEQVCSNLPGLAVTSIKILVDIIESIRDSRFSDHVSIWETFVAKVVNSVIERKPRIIFSEGQIAAAHLLTFSSSNSDDDITRVNNEQSESAAKKIDSSLFYFGTGDVKFPQILELAAGREEDDDEDSKIELRTMDLKPWTEHCFFPSLSQDFFSHLVLWNSWWETSSPRYSLAAIYQKYLTEQNNLPVAFKAKVADAFALELLSAWSIGYASHRSASGQANGVDLTIEFATNLQYITGEECLDCSFDESFNSESNELKQFLKRIKAPYLVNQGSYTPEFKAKVAPFIRLGEMIRPENLVGWDVLFDLYLDEVHQTYGLIECKLWTAPVNYSTIFKYYKRACLGKCPLTYLVGSKFSFEKFESLTGSIDRNDSDDVEEEFLEIDIVGDEPEKPVIMSKKPKIESVRLKLDQVSKLFIDASKKRKKKLTQSASTSKVSTKISNLRSSSISAPQYSFAAALSSSITARGASSEGLLSSILASTKFPDHQNETIVEPLEEIKKISIQEAFNSLWNSTTENNHISIYLLHSEMNEQTKQIVIKQKSLIEFDNPSGVFIIIESDFKPPFRSSSI